MAPCHTYLLAAALACAALPALAQNRAAERFDPPASLAARPAPEESAPPSDPDTGASQRVSPAEAAAESATLERLNREQASFAEQQLADNRAAQEAYRRALQEREALIARQQAEHSAEVARLEAEHAAAMARWEADVAACQAGDRTRCAPSPEPR